MVSFRSVRRPHAFAALVLFWNALLLAGFALELSLTTGPPSFRSWLAAGALLAGNAVDVLLVVAAGAFLVNGGLLSRVVAYALFATHFLGNFVQLASHYLAGEYLSRLAVQNVEHVSLVFSPARGAVVAAAVAVVLTVSAVVESARSTVLRREAAALSLGALALAGLAAGAPRLLPSAVTGLRDRLYEDNNLAGRSPLSALAAVLTAGPASAPILFTPSDAEAARRHGFEISPSRPFPLRKEWIYEGDPPFARVSEPARRPNVIVFFSEGLSARVTGPYGSPFPRITPNLDRFAADPRTMVVTNYYNHTAATYRGLHGQLCSFFPRDEGSQAWLEGPETEKYLSLARYLRDEGYDTSFLDTHRRGAARVDALARRLGFENVLTAEGLSSRYLRGAEPLRDDALSDHQLLDSLVGFLEEQERRPPGSRPFFAGLYNLETHAFQAPARDGLTFGDGRSQCLDTVYSYDDAFGRFLRHFLASGLARDTVVVFTADHCHYPTRGYVEAMGQNLPRARRVFVDAIPLIVYSPFHRLPDAFDAEFRTSLDFAPSLIHLLGLPQAPNPFLGRSIFTESARRERGPGIGAIGPDLFFIDGNGIARRGRLGGQAAEFWRVQRLMRYFADLEENDRIWPATTR